MREHRERERVPPPRAKDGSDDPLAGIDRAPDQPSPVDEESAPVGEIDQRRVPLPNVEECRAKNPDRPPRAARADLGDEDDAPLPRGAGTSPPARRPRSPASPTTIAASCHDVGGGTGSPSACAPAKPRAITRTIRSAPDATVAVPRSAAGHGESSAWTRQSGSAIDSPTGTASRFAATPPRGNVGAKRARIGAQGIVAASVAAAERTSGCAAFGSRAPALAIGLEKRKSPAVAAPERTNDTSNATSASPAAIAKSDQPNARAASARRPSARERNDTVSIHAARRVEPPSPRELRVRPRQRDPHRRRDPRPTSVRAARTLTRTRSGAKPRRPRAPTAITRCIPETASK